MCATFPLIWVGGLVTTYDAGMAVPDWPGTYGYNLFLYPWQTWLFGPWDLFIEHGHRLLGAVVGLLTIALVVSVFRGDRRRWMRVLSLVALVAVIAQGSLGGMRVLMDERQLALIHGCLGPAFFSLAAAIWVMTSRLWREADSLPDPGAARLQVLSTITFMLAYLQLVAGAHLRHVPVQAEPETFRVYVWFHLLGAALLVFHGGLLAVRIWTRHARPALVRPATLLALLLAAQVLLGAATWVAKYGWPMGNERYRWIAGHLIEADGIVQSLTVTGHVAVGSLILATSVALTLRGIRLLSVEKADERVHASWGATT